MEKVIIVDFGGQYNQLIARRIREFDVCAELIGWNTPDLLGKIAEKNPIGIVFTGGPQSVMEENSPTVSEEIFALNIPVLGICYGAQLIAKLLGGTVKRGVTCEYGKTAVNYRKSPIFEGLPEKSVCWMSHTDFIAEAPSSFEVTAYTDKTPVAAMQNVDKRIFAVQFHPEVVHTEMGTEMLKNFVLKVCGAKQDWKMSHFAAEKIAELKIALEGKKVLCAFSGGVDSAVAATLVHSAVGDRLTCIFVNHGLLRKNEAEEVMREFKEKRGMNVVCVDASKRFFKALRGVSAPETKRKIIGKEFVSVFEEEAKKIGKVDYLVQGTIYPDVVESGLGQASVIKSHHNVGGLPKETLFSDIVEPLRALFKDEVRKVGFELGLPEHIVMRQPFPGPGLAIRIVGKVTPKKVKITQDADYIFREEIKNASLDKVIWQYFAVLTGLRTVGVMGDARTYDNIIALRAVTSVDGMTADWADIPKEVMQKISSRIVNEVEGVNRVVYDVTSKPPATIEWE